MHKQCLITACVVCGIVAAMPRAAAAQEIGILKGLSRSTLDLGGSAASAKSRHGLAGGKYIVLPIRQALGIEVNVLGAMKGATLDFGQGDSTQTRLLYLDVPVLGRVSGPQVGSARMHVIAGPSFNLKLSGKLDREGSLGDDPLRRYETAAVLGAGATFDHFRVDARYTWGLTNIISGAGSSAKNRVFNLLIGIVLKAHRPPPKANGA